MHANNNMCSGYIIKKFDERTRFFFMGNLPGSTACTLTGESEQMVKPYPSFPRRMVTCGARTQAQQHKSYSMTGKYSLTLSHAAPLHYLRNPKVECWQNNRLPSCPWMVKWICILLCFLIKKKSLDSSFPVNLIKLNECNKQPKEREGGHFLVEIWEHSKNLPLEVDLEQI